MWLTFQLDETLEAPQENSSWMLQIKSDESENWANFISNEYNDQPNRPEFFLCQSTEEGGHIVVISFVKWASKTYMVAHLFPQKVHL